jgi:response regulator RpfG family c-di-GMP phosphodiesterase
MTSDNNTSQALQGQLVKFAEDVTRLYKELKEENLSLEKANKDLEELYVETILMGFDMINLYDEFLGGHCKRVAYYAEILSQAMSLDEKSVKNVKLAAQLHDIGLIGIPREDLNKMFQGKNESLVKIYKQHPIIKIRPISSSERFKDVASIIAAHHENLDGSGFPNGLRGETILIESRIIAIANGYDVIKQLNPKTVEPEKIINEMVIEAGIKFDRVFFKEFAKLIVKNDPFIGFIDIDFNQIKPGMVLVKPIMTANEKVKLLGANTVIRSDHIVHLKNYFEYGGVKLPIRIYKPKE